LGTSLEKLISGPGILGRALELGLPFDNPADVFRSSDPRLIPVKQYIEQALLIILTAAVVAYEPDVIILGGGISHALEPELEQLNHRLRTIVSSAANSATCPEHSAPSWPRCTRRTGDWASPTFTWRRCRTPRR
jgi:predicted NBD/HSP70 family sugar kinase